MDDAGRAEAARTMLVRKQAELAVAKDAGPACARCRYFVSKVPRPPDEAARAAENQWFALISAGALCAHPAYADFAFSPLDGEVKVAAHVPAITARATDGLCGPEAMLFEPRWKQTAKELGLLAAAWGGLVGGALAIVTLL